MKVLFILVDGAASDEDEPDNEDNKNKDETSNDPDLNACKAATSEGPTSGFDDIVHQNYPVICEKYKDPSNQCEKLALVMQLPSGASNVKIELSDDGVSAIITYQWARSMFNMESLYQKQLTSQQLHIHHPKILCIKNGLQKYRQRIDIAPEAVVKVNLPIKVQTSRESWTKSGVKCEDGSHVLLADFTGFIKNYNTKVADSAVEFE